MAEVTLTLRFFGALRDHGAGATVRVPSGATPSVVREALARATRIDPALLAISAIASDEQILTEDARFEGDAELAVLPPVCGG